MKIINGFYTDDNNNCWNINIFSKDEAGRCSKTLVNCEDCYNCKHCVDCYLCQNCIRCSNCSVCFNCHDLDWG